MGFRVSGSGAQPGSENGTGVSIVLHREYCKDSNSLGRLCRFETRSRAKERERARDREREREREKERKREREKERKREKRQNPALNPTP